MGQPRPCSPVPLPPPLPCSPVPLPPPFPRSRSLRPLQSSEGTLEITLPNELGSYTITYLQTEPAGTVVSGQPSPVPLPVISLISPVSASSHRYTFCPGNLWWTSHGSDGPPHLLIELLSRELIKVCKGYPTF